MRSTAMAAWSATGLAAASVIAVSVGMGLQGGAAAATPSSSAPLVAAAHRSADLRSPTVSPTARPAVRMTAPRQAGEDISGPCDEKEHANDPRCSPAAAATQASRSVRATDSPEVGEDRSGDRGREAGDDRSGDRGREAGDDRSGHGDDQSDDRSGHDDSGHDDSGHDGSGR
jgi:hypothetical protein